MQEGGAHVYTACFWLWGSCMPFTRRSFCVARLVSVRSGVRAHNPCRKLAWLYLQAIAEVQRRMPDVPLLTEKDLQLDKSQYKKQRR